MAVQICTECSTLMNPKLEDGYLVFICDKCEFRADPISPVIFSEDFRNTHRLNITEKQHLVDDVTLPRLKLKCTKCGANECIYYVENTDERALNCFYVCTTCFYEWTD